MIDEAILAAIGEQVNEGLETPLSAKHLRIVADTIARMADHVFPSGGPPPAGYRVVLIPSDAAACIARQIGPSTDQFVFYASTTGTPDAVAARICIAKRLIAMYTAAQPQGGDATPPTTH